MERKRVPQKVNCSSGFEGGATRGTRIVEYERGEGFCQNGKNTGGRREVPLVRIPFGYMRLCLYSNDLRVAGLTGETLINLAKLPRKQSKSKRELPDSGSARKLLHNSGKPRAPHKI